MISYLCIFFLFNWGDIQIIFLFIFQSALKSSGRGYKTALDVEDKIKILSFLAEFFCTTSFLYYDEVVGSEVILPGASLTFDHIMESKLFDQNQMMHLLNLRDDISRSERNILINILKGNSDDVGTNIIKSKYV